ncbi:MAG: gluconate 2-dehydrogenase subunit 3 family protein [Polyangiaceae bacterium]
MPRRQILAGSVGVAVLAVGSTLAAMRARGYALAARRRLVTLAAWEAVVIAHAARRIVAPDDAGDVSIPSADEVDVVGFVDRWVSRLPARLRRDLGRFLAYVEHIAPLGVGSVARFTRLGAADQDRVLGSVESSGYDLVRAGFDALRSLVFLGYYSDPRTFGILGYDGPLAGRPPGGWGRGR